MHHPALLICGQALIKCFKSLSPSSSFQINSYFDKILIISYFLAVPRDQAYLSPHCCHCEFIFNLRLCFSTRTSESCVLQKHVALSVPFQSEFILCLPALSGFCLYHFLSFLFSLLQNQPGRITLFLPSLEDQYTFPPCQIQATFLVAINFLSSHPSCSPCYPLAGTYSPSLHFCSQHNHSSAALQMDPGTRKAIANPVQINNIFKSTWKANFGLLADEKQTTPILGSPQNSGMAARSTQQALHWLFPPRCLCHALPFPNAHMGAQPHLLQP